MAEEQEQAAAKPKRKRASPNNPNVMADSCCRMLNQKVPCGDKKGRIKRADKVFTNLIEIASTQANALGLQAAKMLGQHMNSLRVEIDTGSEDGPFIGQAPRAKTDEELDAEIEVLDAEIKQLQHVLASVETGNS